MLETSQAAALGAVDTLETKRQAGMVQFQDRIIDERIEFGVVKHLKKSHAAGTLAEEAAQHTVLRPNMTLFRGNVLDDIIGRSTQDVFRVGCLLLRYAGRANVLLEERN